MVYPTPLFCVFASLISGVSTSVFAGKEDDVVLLIDGGAKVLPSECSQEEKTVWYKKKRALEQAKTPSPNRSLTLHGTFGFGKYHPGRWNDRRGDALSFSFVFRHNCVLAVLAGKKG